MESTVPDTSRINALLGLADAISCGEALSHQYDECFSTDAFDPLLADTHDAQAFALLQSVCDRFDTVRARAPALDGYYRLLTVLTRRTNTTEKPRGMDRIIEYNTDLATDLCAWYRHSL